MNFSILKFIENISYIYLKKKKRIYINILLFNIDHN